MAGFAHKMNEIYARQKSKVSLILVKRTDRQTNKLFFYHQYRAKVTNYQVHFLNKNWVLFSALSLKKCCLFVA